MPYEERLTKLQIEIHEKAKNLTDIMFMNCGYVPNLMKEIVKYTDAVVKY